MNLKITYFLKGMLLILFMALSFQSCEREELREVTLYDKPYTEASASATTVNFGGNVDFTSKSFKSVTTTWTFAGGNPSSSINPNVTVAYSTPGTYEAKLVVKYIDNSVETKTFSIVVKGIDAPQPYNGTAVVIPGTIEAENYNLGGEGVAYHDTEAQNLAVQNGSAQYRTDDGVDIQVASAATFINYTQNGEWANYTINVPTAGNYDFEFKVASADTSGGASIKLQQMNQSTGATTDIGQTGSFATSGPTAFISKTITGISLPQGLNTIRLFFTGAKTLLDKVNVKVSVPPPPINGVGIFTEKSITSTNAGIIPPVNAGNMAITVQTTNTNHGTKCLFYHFDPTGNGSPQTGYALSHMDLTTSPYNASAYNYLNIAVKSNTARNVRIRLNTNSGNFWVTLKPSLPKYGMLWDGQWHELVIPFSDLLKDGTAESLSTVAAAKSSIKQFTIRTDDSDYTAAANSFDYYIDDIYLTVN
ncbi:carbohydrate-binding protein [Chryseobacterium sp. MMS23-Vi53]|uniref:carbohydrate-binding protein n=1 Tax=Chryseobacterium sp. MMS23-Vi53 TaxID=3386644 RepID=UPI0039E9D7CD